jgi:hypothetical protein
MGWGGHWACFLVRVAGWRLTLSQVLEAVAASDPLASMVSQSRRGEEGCCDEIHGFVNSRSVSGLFLQVKLLYKIIRYSVASYRRNEHIAARWLQCFIAHTCMASAADPAIPTIASETLTSLLDNNQGLLEGERACDVFHEATTWESIVASLSASRC